MRKLVGEYSFVRSGGEEAVDGGGEGLGDGGPGGLRGVHVVPVEVPLRVVAHRVLLVAGFVLLPAVAVRRERLAARPQPHRELVVGGGGDEVEEGGVEVEEEEGGVGGVEVVEDGAEGGVVLVGPGVGQRVAAGVVEQPREVRGAAHGVEVGHHHLLHPYLVAQPPELLPQPPHHRRDVRDRRLACAVVLVYDGGVVVAGDDDERDAGGAAAAQLLLEQVDLRADVALEVARVQHARPAHREVHPARRHLAAVPAAPPQLVRHRRRDANGRSCTRQYFKFNHTTYQLKPYYYYLCYKNKQINTAKYFNG
jgi:hypothetical protein